MIRVTFGGNLEFIRDAIHINKLNEVYVDMSYHYGGDIPDNVYLFDTGIPYMKKVDSIEYGSFDPEVINRRVRIARAMRYILGRHKDEDVMFIDSDVLIRKVDRLDNIDKHKPFTICIMAKAKPLPFIVKFCSSTNIFIPSSYVGYAIDLLSTYEEDLRYLISPIDVYLNENLHSATVSLPNVCHFVLGAWRCT